MGADRERVNAFTDEQIEGMAAADDENPTTPPIWPLPWPMASPTPRQAAQSISMRPLSAYASNSA